MKLRGLQRPGAAHFEFALAQESARSAPLAHYENFPVASRLVPAPLRAAVLAIYAFARAADDIADEGGDAPEARLAKLDHYAAMLDCIERGEVPAEAPSADLAAAIMRHALPLQPFRNLLSAFRQDVLRTRYASFAELADYCSRSANPIGRLLLRLYRSDDAQHCQYADAICTGLQLTNFWQDVALDWLKGRVYLPAEDLARFGVAEGQIGEGRCDARWTRLMAFETERARALLDAGRPLVRALPLRVGLELKLCIAGGSRILAAIDAVRGDVFRQRPRLSRRDWAVMSAVALAR
jgi:squalene synthase HpnC